jgi:hypothetical protein
VSRLIETTHGSSPDNAPSLGALETCAGDGCSFRAAWGLPCNSFNAEGVVAGCLRASSLGCPRRLSALSRLAVALRLLARFDSEIPPRHLCRPA